MKPYTDETTTETITVDIPLFLRIMEFAREDAKGDLDLHVVAENALKLCVNGQTLTMDNYNDIVGDASKEDKPEEQTNISTTDQQ